MEQGAEQRSIEALHLPLVVDLDGTLTPTDTLVESVIRLVRRSPLNLLSSLTSLLKGRAEFKHAISTHVDTATEYLPLRPEVLTYLQEEKAKGRPIVLATAAHHSIAHDLSARLGLFDKVLSTTRQLNLKGEAKILAIQESVGEAFVYAGDSRADLPIWRAAKAAVLVGVTEPTARTIRQEVPIEREFFHTGAGLAEWLRALRVHQWLKNLLLFVPLLTAFSFLDLSKVIVMSAGFLAFSLTASASYILNDLWDLDSDRAHPRKCRRPFACGMIPIAEGLAVAAGILVVAFILAFAVSADFLLMLLLYLVVTSAYSWTLKERVLIDVLVLSLLYTLRIVAGAVAIHVTVSSWLLAFSVLMFLSLALVKRCAELVVLQQNGAEATRGRDYRTTDLVVLWPLGVGASLSAVVVFGLFISAPATEMRYATPQLLWLVGIGMIYWLARLWIMTSRGKMDDDPIVYAIKDLASRFTLTWMILTILVARFIEIPV